MADVTELRTARTAGLGASTVSSVRDLMNAVFGGVSDDTFDSALGGLHALRSRLRRGCRGPRGSPPPGARPVSAPVDLTGELTCDYRPAALW